MQINLNPYVVKKESNYFDVSNAKARTLKKSVGGRFKTEGNTSWNIYSSAVEMCKKVKWILMFHIDPKSNWSNWKRKSLASWVLCNESQTELGKKGGRVFPGRLVVNNLHGVSPEPSCIRGKPQMFIKNCQLKGVQNHEILTRAVIPCRFLRNRMHEARGWKVMA